MSMLALHVWIENMGPLVYDLVLLIENQEPLAFLNDVPIHFFAFGCELLVAMDLHRSSSDAFLEGLLFLLGQKLPFVVITAHAEKYFSLFVAVDALELAEV
jgi:hypothetical protein